MRKSLFVLCTLFLFISEGCRKPDYVYRSPCEDSTLVALYERRQSLSAQEYIVFDSLYSLCEEHKSAEENRGKLWPGILAGIAIVAAVGTALLWFLLRNEGDIE